MTPISTALAAGALIVVGKWSVDKVPTIENGVGVAGIALGLAALEQMNEKLSAAFAGLILVALMAIHLPNIVKSLGFTGAASGKIGSGVIK